MTLRMILFIWAALTMIATLRKAIGDYQPAKLILMKRRADSIKALYIFEGMTSPSAEAGFRQFADAYDGDVYYVEYGHDGCAMDLYCEQVYNHAYRERYHRVDILAVSIGAETYAAFYTLNSFCCFQLDVYFWAVCPFSPGVAYDKVRSRAKIITPILTIAEVALNFLGQIRFIYWNGVWRSFSEIVEQGILAAWGHPLWRRTHYTRYGQYYYIMPNPDYVPTITKRILQGVVLARDDEFIDNDKAFAAYQPHASIAYVDGKHCRLTETDAYVTALRDLGLFK